MLYDVRSELGRIGGYGASGTAVVHGENVEPSEPHGKGQKRGHK